ncbi:hypothetical protein KJ764_05055 [Patescibacteria group bacterium]|nr:hypothetical protein [Patescibacteria group bacterium]
MSIVEILYIILGACIVVITVTIVWLANETIKLVKSLRKSSDDVAFMTQEVKEKVLVVTEALDRAGTAATNIIGFIEDAIEGIKSKRDQLADSIGLVSGVGEYFKKKKESGTKSKEKMQDTIEEESEEEEEESPDESTVGIPTRSVGKKPSKPEKKAEPTRSAFSTADASGSVKIKKPDKKKVEVKSPKGVPTVGVGNQEPESEPDESEDQELEEEK